MKPLTTVPVHDRQILAFGRTSKGTFRHPDDVSRNVIMIGPGTGVAPFRGFLQARRRAIKGSDGGVGQAWLYFGCRHKDKDFLFR